MNQSGTYQQIVCLIANAINRNNQNSFEKDDLMSISHEVISNFKTYYGVLSYRKSDKSIKHVYCAIDFTSITKYMMSVRKSIGKTITQIGYFDHSMGGNYKSFNIKNFIGFEPEMEI